MNITRSGVSNSILKRIYLISILLVTLFVANEEVVSFYYFNSSKIIFYIAIFILMFLIIVIFMGNIYFDLISYLLIFRLGLYLIPLIYIPNIENYWGNYFAVLASFFAYFITSQEQKKDISTSINKIFIIFIIILCSEVFYAYFYLTKQYGSLNINLFKLYLNIPVGASNYIACVLLPFFIFIYNSRISSKLKFFIIFMSLTALLIIQSKNAMFVLVIFITYYIINKYFKSISKYKNSTNLRGTIIISTIILIIFMLLISFLTLRFFINKWNMGMSISNLSLYDLVNALTSNRLNVYENEISRWGRHFFLGNGLSYDLGQSRSHNWAIDLLVQVGIFGFGVYLFTLIAWFKKIKKFTKQNQFLKSCYYFILVIFIQGLAEVSLFTVTIDILLWSIMGLSVSHRNYIVNKVQVKHE